MEHFAINGIIIDIFPPLVLPFSIHCPPVSRGFFLPELQSQAEEESGSEDSAALSGDLHLRSQGLAFLGHILGI
jgi:hypothetical protein